MQNQSGCSWHRIALEGFSRRPEPAFKRLRPDYASARARDPLWDGQSDSKAPAILPNYCVVTVIWAEWLMPPIAAVMFTAAEAVGAARGTWIANG